MVVFLFVVSPEATRNYDGNFQPSSICWNLCTAVAARVHFDTICGPLRFGERPLVSADASLHPSSLVSLLDFVDTPGIPKEQSVPEKNLKYEIKQRPLYCHTINIIVSWVLIVDVDNSARRLRSTVSLLYYCFFLFSFFLPVFPTYRLSVRIMYFKGCIVEQP